MYYEVVIVIEGAEFDSIVFPSDGEGMDEYIDTIEAEANDNGEHYEIFINFHEHDEFAGECFCAQMANDHHPDYEFNRPE